MAYLSNRSSSIPLAFWVFFAALAIRLWVLIQFSASASFLPEAGDMKFYNDWALRILHGQLTDHKAFYGLPGYPYFLALIYWITGYNPFIPGLLQTIAEALTSVVMFKIAAEIIPPRSGKDQDHEPGSVANIVGIIAAAAWTFFQPAQTFSVILMPTSWLVLFFWGCVLKVMQTRTFSVWKPWLWLGLLIGVLTMMIATMLFLVPLIIAAIVLLSAAEKAWSKRFAKTAAASALLVFGVFAGAAPCWIHNYFIAGEPVFLSAHSGVNFYIGNNPLANGYPKIPPGLRAGQEGMLKDSITMAEAESGRKLKRTEVSHFWSEKASAYIHGHFWDWLKLMGVKFANFWNAYQYDDLSLITLFKQNGIILPGLKFGIIAALGIPGLFVAVWKYPRSRWVAAAVLLHMAALMPVFITERYRLAAVPGLILLGTIGLLEFRNLLSQGLWRQSALYIAGAAASVVFVTRPSKDPGLWSLDYYNTGIRATEVGDLGRAQRNLEIAFSYVPDNSEINFALGNVWLQKGDRTAAKLLYRRAIEINSRHSGAYNNLGVLAMEEKRWKLAETFFTHSLQVEPKDAKTHFLLARAQLELGDIAGAEQSIETAISLRPGQKEFEQLAGEISRKQKPQ